MLRQFALLALGAWMCVSFLNCAIAAGTEVATDENRLSLDGSDWFIHADSGTNESIKIPSSALKKNPAWIPASVPGNIQADLESAHLLGPLWYGAGDPRLAEVTQTDWWYRKDFVVPNSFKGKRVRLVFDGVDMECEVFLNGERLGAHAGMFDGFAYEVAPRLRIGKENHLAVRLSRLPVELAKNWSGEHLANTRRFYKNLKSATNHGWDWGVPIYTLGIWRDVRLEASGPARIDFLQVKTDLPANQQATLSVSSELDAESDRTATIQYQINGPECMLVRTQSLTLKQGKNMAQASFVLDHPALWWPQGQGEQPLYTLNVQLVDGVSKKLFSARSTRFGIRQLDWVQVEGAPTNFINPFQLVINGRPVRTMGSCIIPPDLLFGRIAPKVALLIQRARELGINTLRVWGGGVVLPDEFYDLADENGIMLIQEFPLANSWPETNEVFLANLDHTITDIVKKLRNHPSIIEWDGGNEMPWKQGTDHPALHVLEKVVADNDTRIFRATCPIQGSRHGPWQYNYKTYYDFYNHLMTMRHGEFGAPSPANLEVWEREIPPLDQWPIEGITNSVLVRKKVVQAFGKTSWLEKPNIDALFGPLENLGQTILAGQFLGAEGLRYAMDAHRRDGPRIGGFTSWDFNEPWPNGAGSYLVDYDGRPLMNYDFVKQALAPVTISLKYNSLLYDSAKGVQAELWLSSDAPRGFDNLQWKWLVRDRRGEVIGSNQGDVISIEPRQNARLDTIQVIVPERSIFGPVFVESSLRDSQGALLMERIQAFGLQGVSHPFAALLAKEQSEADDRLDEISIDPNWATNSVGLTNNEPLKITPARSVRQTTLAVTADAVRHEAGNELLELSITNTGSMTALFCQPHPLIDYRTDLSIENNNCFIPPHESRVITITAQTSTNHLSLSQLGWRLTCWNAEEQILEPNASVLLSVGRRDQMCREFMGYSESSAVNAKTNTRLIGTRPNPASLPFILNGPDGSASFTFDVAPGQAHLPSVLQIHCADQSSEPAAKIEVRINGRRFEAELPRGLGIQNFTRAHRAFPVTTKFALPKGYLNNGKNILEVHVKNKGWFTWDALELIEAEP